MHTSQSIARQIAFCIVLLSALCPEISLGRAFDADLLLRNIVAARKKTYQFYLEVDNAVYNPEKELPLSERHAFDSVLIEESDRAFTQKILFIRDEFLGIETFNAQGKKVHSYIRFLDDLSKRPGIKNYAPQSRLFVIEDILPPFVLFFSKFVSQYKYFLDELDIGSEQVNLVRSAGRVYYTIGLPTQSHLRVNPDNFRIESILRSIEIDELAYPLSITFSGWHKQKEHIPQEIQYFIDGRLFKRSQVRTVRLSGLSAIRRAMIKNNP